MHPHLHPLITLAFVLGFIVFAGVPVTEAGDRSYPAKQVIAVNKTPCCQQSRSRCDRRCQRLARMLQKRGCSCPNVARAIHPVRAHTYLSRHYPPFRYSR